MNLSRSALTTYVGRQIDNFFPDGDTGGESLAGAMPVALDRTLHCLGHLKTFKATAGATFNHLYADHYQIFLYFLSNQLFRERGHCIEAAKVYYLNRALHALDAYYDVHLPEIFAIIHGVGTVLGRAKYSNYLYVYQSVTVGISPEGESPELDSGVVLFPGSKVVGRTLLGTNTIVGVGTTLLNRDIPANHVVGGPHGSVLKPTKRNVKSDFFLR